jgi:type III restriction enzyme
VDQTGQRLRDMQVNTLTVIAHESYREFAEALQKDFEADGHAFGGAGRRIELKDADDRRPVPVRRAVLDGADFKALWERIKHKTTYRVAFDPQRLIEACIRAVREAPPIGRARLHWRKAGLAIGEAGVTADEQGGAELLSLDEADIALPDLLTDLHDRTQLTRRSLVRILIDSGRLQDYARNPQRYIETVADAILRCKRLALVDGIRYQRLGDDAYYAQELFERQELSGYLRDMLRDAHRSVYEHVLCDSEVERAFAAQLERHDAVKVYAKLPPWFKVPTPLGHYNPDWAVLVATPAGERLYFVAETKGSLVASELRDDERVRSDYGRAHFEALAEALAPTLPDGERPARYGRFTNVAGLLALAQGLDGD